MSMNAKSFTAINLGNTSVAHLSRNGTVGEMIANWQKIHAYQQKLTETVLVVRKGTGPGRAGGFLRPLLSSPFSMALYSSTYLPQFHQTAAGVLVATEINRQ